MVIGFASFTSCHFIVIYFASLIVIGVRVAELVAHVCVEAGLAVRNVPSTSHFGRLNASRERLRQAQCRQGTPSAYTCMASTVTEQNNW